MVLRVGLWVSAVVATHGVAGLFLPNVYIRCFIAGGRGRRMLGAFLLSDSIRSEFGALHGLSYYQTIRRVLRCRRR